jgi:L-threonylcarbamoyladenylate synthase
MRSVPLQEFMTDERQQQAAAATLRDEEGLVCFPCRGTYRIAASLMSEEGVLELLQTKRRARHKPALVLVQDARALEQLAEEIPSSARKLIGALWPGDVTLRLPVSREELPSRVYKELSKPDRKVGFRVAVSPVAQLLVKNAGVPLLVSSANLSQKGGATSVAAIRKNFGRRVGWLIDSGDLPGQSPSTVVDFEPDGAFRVVRVGTVCEESIAAACASGHL